jgi:hypothetical protein
VHRSPPAVSAPILLRFTLHGRCVRVLHFEPVGRATGVVGRILSLRDNAFEAKLAGVAKHGLAVAFHVLIEPNARCGLDQRHFQLGFAPHQRISPQVVAIQFNKVEGVEKDAFIVAAIANDIERSYAVVIASNRLTIDGVRERRRSNVSTISGKRWVRSLPGRL